MVQPTLQDLHDELQAGGDQVSRYLADALNPYITGSMSGFNGQTNVDLSNRFTVFDVSGLSGELRTFGMMVVVDQVWNRVIRNKANGRRTWLYVDEFHRFFSNQYAAAQFRTSTSAPANTGSASPASRRTSRRSSTSRTRARCCPTAISSCS